MGSGPLERIFAAGAEAVRSGSHGIEGDPRQTGRWGPSIVVRPSGAAGERLTELTRAAVGIVGDHHWQSGADGRAHLTVRALEPHADSIEPERLNRYRTALHAALCAVGSIRLELRHLGLSPGSLMVGAVPLDSAAQSLRERLGSALGPDGWLEDKHYDNGRDPIWYCSILHYAAPITEVDALLEWVAGHTDTSWGHCEITDVDICTWRFDGSGMAPQVVASVGGAHKSVDTPPD